MFIYLPGRKKEAKKRRGGERGERRGRGWRERDGEKEAGQVVTNH